MQGQKNNLSIQSEIGLAVKYNNLKTETEDGV